MVLVKADEMARSLDSQGHVALYGIFFDTNKTDLKPEMLLTPTEIAQLLKMQPKSCCHRRWPYRQSGRL